MGRSGEGEASPDNANTSDYDSLTRMHNAAWPETSQILFWALTPPEHEGITKQAAPIWVVIRLAVLIHYEEAMYSMSEEVPGASVRL